MWKEGVVFRKPNTKTKGSPNEMTRIVFTVFKATPVPGSTSPILDAEQNIDSLPTTSASSGGLHKANKNTLSLYPSFLLL